MIRVPARLFPLLAILLFQPLPASAQYLYLDTDGDGLRTAADRMAENGTETTVRAYLVTNRDRLGSVRSCGDGTGNGINVYSYAVNLQVAGGTVAFGAVTSASPFTTDIGSSNPGDGVRNYVSFVDASGAGQPEGGPHFLFALPVNGASGTPRLDVVISVSPPMTGTDPTYFGSACLGDNFSSNIWFLGTTPGAVDGEWYDVDGLSTASGVNQPPVLAAIGDTTIDEGQIAEQALTATDSDGAPLAFSKASGPAYMTVATLDPGSGTGTGTVRLAPGFTDAGIVRGTVRVSDGLAADETSFGITVDNVPRPLDLFDIPDFTMKEGFGEEGTLVASNPDGGYVHFEKAQGPWFMEVHDFAPLTGRLSISVPYDQSVVGVHPATVTATDGIQSDSESFTITVTDYEFAIQGEWYAFAPPRAGVGQYIYVSMYDGDGDLFTSLTFDPGNIATAGGTYNFSPFLYEGGAYGYLYWAPTTLGQYHFSATGTHAGGVSLTLPFEVEITSFERPPTSRPGGPYSGLVGIPVEFDGRASSDPDGDPLNYYWYFGDGGRAVGSVAQHVFTSQGTFSVQLQVFDGYVYAYGFTTAQIVDALEARAFQKVGRDPVRLSSHKPSHCFGLEPVGGSYRNEDMDPTSLRLVWGGSSIAVVEGKAVAIEDFDRNGIPEISACFSKEALRTLFASLPVGTHDVAVRLEGRLVSGAKIRAPFTLTVVNTPALAASVSPNPLNPDAILTFRTAAPGRVSVSLYDVRGRRVRTLHEGELPTGFHDVRIDGRSDKGTRLPSGVYFYSIESAEGTRRGRLTVVR